MAEETLIAWTDHTFNIAWGCTKISPGCAHCYADTLASRYGHDVWGAGRSRRTFGEKHWRQPADWNRLAIGDKRRHRVFTSSMCDVFEDHPTIAAEREKLWDVIRATRWLDWQVLTKRADRIRGCLPPDWGQGWDNVWLGVSVEHIDYEWRADCLRDIPAAVRFVSYEPALGPLHDMELRGLDWVIFGGESGVGFRAADAQWSRDMRDACAEAGVAYFHKQLSHRFTERGTMLDGVEVRQYPTPRRHGAAPLAPYAPPIA